MGLQNVYSPADALEAHMLVHLLGEHGITAFVMGEDLLNLRGELPAHDLLRIAVPEEDYDEARSLLLEWERQNQAPAEPSHSPAKRNMRSLGNNFLSLVIGITIGAWLVEYKNNLTLQEIIGQEVTASPYELDVNEDGRIDSIYYYENSQSENPSLLKEDMNFDGKMDVISTFDSVGSRLSDEADYDFDGRFETKTAYRYGLPLKSESDRFDTGKNDVVTLYKYGMLEHMHFYDERGGLIKSAHYNHGDLATAELDSDKDGTLDQRHYYDRYEEIERIEKIN